MSPTATDLAASAGPHVLVEDLQTLAVAPDDWHHLTRVLRARTGDELTATDGRGRWQHVVVGNNGLEPDGETFAVPEPRQMAMGFALVKGAKPELIVQKLTELGVATIAPFEAARSIVRWDDAKRERAGERWRRIAREALMQSKGAWLPTVAPLRTFEEIVSDEGDHLVRADIGAPVPASWSDEQRMILIGPEGGWSDDEREALPGAVGLGDRVLRAETAAITVGVLLTT